MEAECNSGFSRVGGKVYIFGARTIEILFFIMKHIGPGRSAINADVHITVILVIVIPKIGFELKAESIIPAKIHFGRNHPGIHRVTAEIRIGICGEPGTPRIVV